MNYDVTLFQKPLDGYLNKDEAGKLIERLNCEDAFLPINIEVPGCDHTVAMGFITYDAADMLLNFDYSGLSDFLGKIMGDTSLETTDDTYYFITKDGNYVRIYMGYAESEIAKSGIEVTIQVTGYYKTRAKAGSTREEILKKAEDAFYSADFGELSDIEWTDTVYDSK